MLLPNLKIGARLGLGFALVLAMLAAVIGLGLASMAGIDARMKQIVGVFRLEPARVRPRLARA
jgi:methyl-accepting chemotaxis protein